MNENLSAGRKIVLAIGLLKRYKARREDDMQLASAAGREISGIATDIADLEVALNHLGTLTLGDVTN